MSPRKPIFLLFLSFSLLLGVAALFYWLGQKQGRPPSKELSRPALYQCPMHPSVISDKPGQCPICKMELRLIPSSSQPTAATEAPQEANYNWQGRASFALSKHQQQLIGVSLSPVMKKKLQLSIRASGRVAYDPELYTAIEDYRQALLFAQSIKESEESLLQQQAKDLRQAAATRLKLLGLSPEQIASDSRRLDEGMQLLLPQAKVWIYAELFEYEIRGLRTGLDVEVSLPALDGKIFKGKIAAISPILNAPTRTVRVRAQVPDPQGLLKPDSFVNVTIFQGLGESLAIPAESVMFTGEEAFVFVKEGEGLFTPKPVVLGPRAGSFYQLLHGLQEGQELVTSANFLIDSEARLRGVSRSKEPSGGHHDH